VRAPRQQGELLGGALCRPWFAEDAIVERGDLIGPDDRRPRRRVSEARGLGEGQARRQRPGEEAGELERLLVTGGGHGAEGEAESGQELAAVAGGACEDELRGGGHAA